MTNLPQPLPHISKLKAYTSGASKPMGVKDYRMRLSHNEGAFGPSPKALAAYASASTNIHRYPDYTYVALRQAIAAHFGLQTDRVICGQGSDQLITLLPHVYAGPGDDIVFSQYGFSVYATTPGLVGANAVVVPEENVHQTVDRLIAHFTPRTKLFYLANPNNPTGQMFTRDDVLRLHAALPPTAIFVYDAAYADFVTDANYADGFEFARQFPNFMVLRTFSKIHALAGLRIGFGYAQPHIIDALNRARDPFNICVSGEAAVIASLHDKEFWEKSRNHNAQWREWMYVKLRTRNDIDVYPSQGNYIMFNMRGDARAKALYEHLLSCGIQIRPMLSYNLPSHLRLTIGKPDDMKELWEAMDYFFKTNS